MPSSKISPSAGLIFLDRHLRITEPNQLDFTTFFKQGKDNDFITGISEKWSGAIPYTLIIDKDGVTHTEWEGKADYQDFQNALLEVIK